MSFKNCDGEVKDLSCGGTSSAGADGDEKEAGGREANERVDGERGGMSRNTSTCWPKKKNPREEVR